MYKEGDVVKFKHHRCCHCQPGRTLGKVRSVSPNGQSVVITHTLNLHPPFNWYYHKPECIEAGPLVEISDGVYITKESFALLWR